MKILLDQFNQRSSAVRCFPAAKHYCSNLAGQHYNSGRARRTAMKTRCWLVIALFAAIFAWAQQGTAPRASAEKYAAHAENSGARMGAARLTSGQVTKAFSLNKLSARDLDENCVVVEVALYPAKDGALEVELDKFALRVSGQDTAVKASTPTAAVAAIPYYVQLGETSSGGGGIMAGPRPQLDSPTGVNRDPITGMPRRSVGLTPAGTDVGIGGGGESGKASLPPERQELASKMTEKALPQGKTTAPVAGYVYFSVETKKGEKYQLEYTLNGKNVVLPL
jgi:hypothetical protein